MIADEPNLMATTRLPPEGPSAKGQKCAIALCSDPRPSALGAWPTCNNAQVEQFGAAPSSA